jgi:urocanate hydratase
MRPVDSRDVSLAIANALRYFPAHLHPVLGPEFLEELEEFGHVYMYRFRPLSYRMRAYPESAYPGKSSQTRAIQMMIMNNLDPDVAQYPHELVTYGGNGAVFSNW